VDANRTITRTDEPRSTQKRSSYLFLVFGCDHPFDPGARFRLNGIDAVELGRADSLRAERTSENGARVLRIGIPDPRISSTHARLEKVLGSWMVVDRNSKNGTLLDGTRTSRSAVADGAILELGHTFFLFHEEAATEGPDELRGVDLKPLENGLATFSPALAARFERVVLVARSDSSVLLQGETGTGKEVLARAIHEASGRPGPFVAVNCGAIPATLVESELFGHRKGTFTGAEEHPGLVRSSDRGTLLLDEIGDLPLPAQAALLRVLQEKEVLAVGSVRPLKVDLRVVAATHRDLTKLGSEGTFRTDLLARLSGFTFHLPPLRERREDLGLLVAALLCKSSVEEISFTAEAARALLLHDWPRNIRELEKCVVGAVVLSKGGKIDLEHLPDDVRGASEGRPSPQAPDAPVEIHEEDDRKRCDELVAQLRAHHGNVTETARAMGKARTQIQRWLRRCGLNPVSFR
jgi:sigma-54 dependent transcriptional regulator, acetoin dehydrogenase operon transcriptional activator AcoR